MHPTPSALRQRLPQIDLASWQPLFDFLDWTRVTAHSDTDPAMPHRHADHPFQRLKEVMDRVGLWVECNWRNWPLGERIYRNQGRVLAAMPPVQVCAFLSGLYANHHAGGCALDRAFANGTVLRAAEALAAFARETHGL